MDNQLQVVAQIIGEIIAAEPGYFLVEVKIKPVNNIKVFIDADQGATLEKLTKFNRRIAKQFEETGLYPEGEYSLEVSSPGGNEPLKLLRQYVKNIGRTVEVIQKDGIKVSGKLISANENKIVLEEEKGKNKKKEMLQHSIAFENIKSTTIRVVF